MEWFGTWITVAVLAQTGGSAAPPAPKTAAPGPSAVAAAPVPATQAPAGQTTVVVSEGQWHKAGCPCANASTAPDWKSAVECCEPGPLESDHAFDGFVGPITSPVYAKDPRSLTELRGLYVHNWNGDGALDGGDFDFYGLQARLAVNERLQLFVDKAGYLSLNSGGVGDHNGWLNTAFGFKYTFLRDVECQRIAAVGLMYEMPTGEERVFQGRGDGYLTPFLTYGREFGNCWHFIGNAAYSAALDSSENSSFLFTQIHLDKGINGWLYPLVEANWYYYTQSGNTDRVAGERDGLLAFGNEGTAGSHRVTLAAGLKAKLSKHVETGFAYERSILGGDSLLDNRVIGEVILRY